jgi:hypothetical protein
MDVCKSVPISDGSILHRAVAMKFQPEPLGGDTSAACASYGSGAANDG